MIEAQAFLDGDPLADIADQLMPLLDELYIPEDDPLQALDWEQEQESGWFDPTTVDPPLADLGVDALLDELQATHRRIAACQAREALLITELAHRRAEHAVTELTGRQARGLEALTIGARAVGEEVSLELSLSKSAGQNLTDTCVGLCLEAPDTLDALLAGEIDWPKAAAILLLVQKLVITQADVNPDLPAGEQVDPEELGRELEKRLLDKAANETVAGLRKRGRREMISANPRAAECRARRERTRRFFAFSPDDDSMARLSAYLPADAGMRAKNALTRLAYHARHRGEAGDGRTLDQLRVDALVETLVRAAESVHEGDEDDDPQVQAKHASDDAVLGKPVPDRPASDRPVPDQPVPDQPVPDQPVPDQPVPNPAASNQPAPEAPGPDTNDGYFPDADMDDEVGVSDLDDTVDDRDLRIPESATAKDDENDYDKDDVANRQGASPGRAVSTRPRRDGLTRSTASRFSNSDPRVQITISASTLIGVDDHPGWLHGYGPIIASMARDIAATGTWRCAITDPLHGTLMGLGTGTYTAGYRPTQALRRHLQARDRVCRVPGCHVPAELCDIDHRLPWRKGGPTCECCTECLCKTHHRMKHECGFTLDPSTDPSDPPGTLIWLTPAGRGHPSYPARLADPDPRRPDAPNVVGSAEDGTATATATATAPVTGTGSAAAEDSGPRPGSGRGAGDDRGKHPNGAECRACAEADATNAAENSYWERSERAKAQAQVRDTVTDASLAAADQPRTLPVLPSRDDEPPPF